jgi:hypothetical protein
MKNCRSFVTLISTLAVLAAAGQTAWGISGSVTDNRIGAGNTVVMVFAVRHQTQIDPFLAEIECASVVSGTYPNYSFNLPCLSTGNYDIGVVGWDGPTQDGPPAFVTDLKINIPYDTANIALNIQPNSSHISGDLYDLSSFSPIINREGEVWAYDLSGNLAGIAFANSNGHFDFGYLPGSGPYNLIAKVEGYWQGSSLGVPNPGIELFALGKAFEAQVSNSSNTGYNYDYNQYPEAKSWILSDASNADFTLTLRTGTISEGALPVNWVMIRYPGGAFEDAKFFASSSTAAYAVDPGLDWDSINIDQSGVQDRVIFSQGNGVAVISPQDSAEFTVQVASMENVPSDNYTGLEVIVSNNDGSNKAYFNADLAQKILRITDLSFYPTEVDTSNQTGPGSVITVSAKVENHGSSSFTPYDNWTNFWSVAFAGPGTKITPGPIGSGSFSTLALLDVPVTSAQATYQVYSNVSDSSDQSTSWIPYQESLEVISTGVEDQGPGTLPKGFSLQQNFPNPFNASTRIDYSLAASGFVSLEIYNILGQKVRTLVWQSQTPGAKSAYWDGTNNSGDDIPTGMYFYRLQTSTKSLTKKMTLIR